MSTNKDTDTPPLQDASAAFEQALQEKDQDHYLLKLYVSGMTPNSQRAIKNVQKICEEHLHGRFELEIIDIYQQPIFAKDGQIVAVPTLVKEPPPPCANLSATCRKPSGFWPGWIYARKIRGYNPLIRDRSRASASENN